MRIKKLDICGFKSFPDKVSITFPPGVSAVVGPNGCGKSNIVDAICWVTGEQSVKQLRGKTMEDVIFSGASNRPMVNMAEVSLTFDNHNGSAPEQYRDIPEIMVTRRLYRSGESGYYINRRPCRLKDIHNLLAGSGAGTRTYAVIQQGNIGAITEAGPDERRVFIEDAAGITRYKTRKKEALSKMESTKQNLLRVMDIIAEVERGMKGLARQAKKAQRYREYKAQLKAVEVALAAHKFDRLSEKIAENKALLAKLSDEKLSFESRRHSLDAAMEQVRAEGMELESFIEKKQEEVNGYAARLTRLESDLERTKSASARLEKEADSLEREKEQEQAKYESLVKEKREHERAAAELASRVGEIRESLEAERRSTEQLRKEHGEKSAYLEEQKSRLMQAAADQARAKSVLESAQSTKQDIARRLSRVDGEAAAAQKEEARIGGELETARTRLEEISQDKADTEGDIAATESALEEVRSALSAKLKQVQQAEVRKSTAKSELLTLRRMARNNEWYRQGVRVLLSEKEREGPRPGFAEGIHGLVADVITPHAGWEPAVEAALGESLQYLIVSDPRTASEAIGHLERSSLGRAGFIPLTWVKGEDPNASGGVNGRSLMHNLDVKEGYEDLVSALLSRVEVAEDEAEALTRKNGGGPFTVVTRRGDRVLLPLAMVGGRSADDGPGILSQKSRLRELEKQLAAVEAELAALKEEQKDLE
ncbi:MAG: chromosome segregation protein SMC, partial [Deltaproteobacteria bacterium]|nr:chromosome segregation protein SMC [Deltaproteobacteria bacterium]